MKKIICLLAVCGVILASCGEDFLDRLPRSELTSTTFYKIQADLNQATLSAYHGLRNLYNGDLIKIGEIRSDNTGFSWLAGNPANERGINEFKEPLSESNSYVTNVWNNAYMVIMRCNLVLSHIGTATFPNTEAGKTARTQYEGEARFLRALMYFWLNRTFGGYSSDGQLLGVCKVDKPISQAEAYEIGRSTLEEIYNFIIEDLTLAITNLPKSYPATDKGRVTKAGAEAMLAKVYMFMAGYPLNKGNEYYQKAIQQMDHFFATYPEVKLVPSYQTLFSNPANPNEYTKNTEESLFEIQYKKGAPGGATGSPWNNDFAPRFSDKEAALVGAKSGNNAPTVNMAAAYENGDPRKNLSMREGYKATANQGAWLSEGYVCKYYDVSTSGSDNGNNWIELRLADIYLLYAEALVRTGGNKTVALEKLNAIRERARNTPSVSADYNPLNPPPAPPAPEDLLKAYTLADFVDDDAFLLAIERERRVELAFENHRWFDLVRTERAKDVMSKEQADQGWAFTWDDKMLMYPIPETAMQSNPGKLIQNKGYTQL